MSDATEQPHASVTPTEAESLLVVLERNRRTFAWKTAGLDDKGLSATTAASAMTLGGLIKHVALVEADWLAVSSPAGSTEPLGTPWISTQTLLGTGAPGRWTLQQMSTQCGETLLSAHASWCQR